MDGEKDARNLMLAFKLVQFIAQTLDIREYSEDLFDVVFCYFPITFRTPANDPYGISSDDLRAELKKCFTASPLFADYAMPLLMEKLSSSAVSAKNDALDVVAAVCPIYGFKYIAEYALQLWEYILPEMQQGNEVAISALASILQVLSSGRTLGPSNLYDTMLDKLSVELDTLLENPSSKQAKAVPLIVRTLKVEQLSLGIASKMITRYENELIVTHKRTFCDVIVACVAASESLLDSLKDRIFQVFASSIASSSDFSLLKISGINGIAEFIYSSLTSEVEKRLCFQHLSMVVLGENDEIAEVAIEKIIKSLDKNLDLVIETVVADAVGAIRSGSPQQERPLFLLEKLSINSDRIFDLTCSFFLEQSKGKACQLTLDSLSHGFVDSMARTLSSRFLKEGKVIFDSSIWTFKLFVFCLRIFIESKATKENMNAIFLLMATCVRSCGRFPQIDQILSFVDEGKEIEVDGFKLSALQLDSLQHLMAVTAIVSNMKSSRDWQSILHKLLHFKTADFSLLEYQHLAVASLVNRTSSSLETVKKWLENPEISHELKVNICKGLIIKCDSSMDLCVSYLLNSLETSETGADAFLLVLKDRSDGIFTRKSHANVKILYKQRFYHKCVSSLLERFTVSSHKKLPFLKALSCLMANVPKQVLLQDLARLLPVILTSLNAGERDVMQTGIEALNSIADENPKVIVSHLKDIITRVLDMTQKSVAGNSLVIRLKAVEFLDKLTIKLGRDDVLPFAKMTIKQLEMALADPKRVVRRASANARLRWIFLLEPVDK